ncbi:MAG: CBS domain-containing protein [Negativicutes bacterium]|nr:CBS domain-containing protein [Negativicutes bacterium]
MTKEVVSVGTETKINEVAKIMTKNKFHSLPVVSEDGCIVGIVSRYDFFSKSAVELHLPSYINFIKDLSIKKEISGKQKKSMEKLLDTRVKDIMTQDCVCFSAETDLKEAISAFKEKNLNTIPVVDKKNGKLLGVVTLADIISLL